MTTENKSIAVVIPWYPEQPGGGAEAQCRALVRELMKRGISVEVLTTCVKDFRSDWNTNYWKPGTYQDEGVTVRRFRVRHRNVPAFDAVNLKLMHDQQISKREEKIFMDEMIHSPDLIRYAKKNAAQYRWFIAIPYMFGTTYDLALALPEKTYMIPCFHDERYAYLDIFKKPFRAVRGFCFNTSAEQRLAQDIFKLTDAQCHVLGEGVSLIHGTPGVFRNRYALQNDYILYAGRKDYGKNVDQIVAFFDQYNVDTAQALSLVLIGAGRVELPEDKQDHIIDLGFVTQQEKYDAMADALALCQPSLHESFSLVMMESWLVQRPVLVNGGCAVTREHVINANGGLWYDTYEEFREALDYLYKNRDAAATMGSNGERYVKSNFTHDIVTARYVDVLFGKNR